MKQIIIFLILVIAASCIDPYHPNLEDYKSLLVVEGLVTNEKSPYIIQLARTINEVGVIPEKVSDADVFLTDEEGIETHFQNCGDGSYKTDSTVFVGVVGKKYTLHILTSNGKEYMSESCAILPAVDIDSIYYEKDEEIASNQEESLVGIKIYLNSGETNENNQYFRWEFEEVWKFKLPSPKKYDYYSDSEIVPLNEIKEFCWKTNKSGTILTNSILPGQANSINKEPLLFIPTGKSDRLLLQYSILVKQYSISKKEYDFWNNLKQVNESGGDIFTTQPFPVISNIHNKSDPSEMVLGYFEVSAVKEKRIFITSHELDSLALPHYNYNCTAYVMSPEDFPPSSSMSPPLTFDDIYNMYMSTGDFTFVEPIYNPDTGELLKLVFATNICSDCKLTGVTEKPDFWIDLK
jgi:hypothetical protein